MVVQGLGFTVLGFGFGAWGSGWMTFIVKGSRAKA